MISSLILNPLHHSHPLDVSFPNRLDTGSTSVRYSGAAGSTFEALCCAAYAEGSGSSDGGQGGPGGTPDVSTVGGEELQPYAVAEKRTAAWAALVSTVRTCAGVHTLPSLRVQPFDWRISLSTADSAGLTGTEDPPSGPDPECVPSTFSSNH